MNLPSPPSGGFPLKPSSERNSARFSNASSNSTASSASNQPLLHIQDLQEKALKGLDKNQSISLLVTTAESSLRQAVTLLEYRRPDLAYSEYLRCYELLVNCIYQNPEYPTFTNSKGPMCSRYHHLLKRLRSREEQFTSVKEIIENDNRRNGTKPSHSPPPTSGLKSPGSVVSQADSFDVGHAASKSPNGHASIQGLPMRPPKPPISDKPASLRSRPLSAESNGTTSSNDVLSERFAKLRMAPSINTSYSRPQSRESQASTPGLAQSPVDFRNYDMRSPTRPNGPRAMNGGYGQTNGILSLDAQVAAAMPQPPTPAYSPARNMQTSGDIDPPRTSARSMVGTGGRSNSVASSVAANHPPGGDDSEYFTKTAASGGLPRRKSVYLPKETRVGAEKLYDYLKMHSVLLIDCRGREEFDNGHIYSASIICIEPTALRKDMSAEQLQDSLVLSPDKEQEYFAIRDNFDLVVYYDASTSSDQYLRNPQTPEDFSLRYLHDALFEYSEKPLQRPPILLMGGIEAWSDLVGNQALVMTNTAAEMRNARPIKRYIAPDPAQRIQNQKRRLRDYNPLDADEEKRWRERARKESVVVETRPIIHEEEDSVDETIIDDFNRRFPDAATLGQPVVSDLQEMHQPPRPPKIPEYPSPPPPSQMSFPGIQAPPVPALPTVPTVPKRPAPAAPRMSYSGVNERSVSLTKSADLPAYIPHHLQPSNLRLPRTGLVNFGVTCYMNATIQALSATLPLSVFFLDDRYKSAVQRDNWKGSKGVLPDLFANLVRSIWKGDVDSIRPSTLRAFCARLNREWGIDRQQDAKEFLDFLLDCLHEDLNANWSRTPLRALTEDEEIEREKRPKLVVSKLEWARYTHREQSYLANLFAGQHASRLKCSKCHFTSTTYEAFYSISVEIPRTGKSTIQECLKSYCAEEMLSSDEMWKCPRCKKQREASKQISITRAPQFLVVHFKRFAAGKQEGSAAKKVRTPIDFPLEKLDLEPYMLAQPQSVERDLIVRDFGLEHLKTDHSMTPPYLYDAYAVMRHIGTTMSSGHYTCLARDRARKCWRHYNDTQIQDFDPDRTEDRGGLGNEMAYIVFYERRR